MSDNGEEEQGYEYYEEEDKGDGLDDLAPDHPLLAPIQQQIYDQLSEQYTELEEEIRVQKSRKNKLTDDREEVGVQLYTIQQQLAKLQQKLTDINEQKKIFEDERLQSIAEKDQIAKMHAERQQLLEQRTQDYETQRSELEKLNDVLIRLEQHCQEISNQVAVTRRETYKSEQSASETETAKREQDYYIDRLQNQIQETTKQIEIIEAQILAQRSETKIARDALLQASNEMDRINFERNHLYQDWNSAIIGVKRQSQTKAEIEAAYAKQEEEIRTYRNEEAGLREQIKDQEEIEERNTSMLNKIKSRLQHLEGKMAETKEERAKRSVDLKNLNDLISEQEKLLSRLGIERNSANSDFKLSMKGANEISNQIHTIEDRIVNHVTEQSNLKRDASAAQSAVEKVRQSIEAKDRELSTLQNETVRLRIDKLNILAQTEKLQRGLQEIVGELQAKDQLISQYEMQKRRYNVDIEKKQAEVDKLNRQYESLMNAQNGEEYGPLERKIRQIESRISQSEKTSQETEAQWLKKQTELVTLSQACEEIVTNNEAQNAHITVLTRKRDRTRTQHDSTTKEIEKLEIQIRLLQREMSRLGGQLSESVGSGNALVEGNINFEAEILETLKKKEEESIHTEREIQTVADEREELAEKLMETEKEIMLWEKKIELAREMKDALDPNYGASEIKQMKGEISRMELRLKQIKQQQQTILTTMQQDIARRKNIATNATVQQRLNQEKTHAAVNRGISDLKRDLRRLKEEGEKHNASMDEDVQAQRNLSAEIEQLAHISREKQLQKSELESGIAKEEAKQKATQVRLEKLQEKQRLFQGGEGKKTIIKSPDAFEGAYTSAKHQEEQLVSLIDNLMEDNPHLMSNLQAIKDAMYTV